MARQTNAVQGLPVSGVSKFYLYAVGKAPFDEESACHKASRYTSEQYKHRNATD
jgi:hypothetical protein